MQWFTHPHFIKYEVSYSGVVRNKNTKRELKPFYIRKNTKPRLSVMDYGGISKTRSYGAFVLEAINNVKEVENFIFVDGNYDNSSYYNLKAVPKAPRGRRVAQISLTGSIVKIWPNIIRAKQVGGFCEKSILLNCKGKIKSHGGFHWCYEENIPTTKITLLVAERGDECHSFGTTEQAYLFFKQMNIIECTLSSFRVNISKSKSKGTLFLGYEWTTKEKYIES